MFVLRIIVQEAGEEQGERGIMDGGSDVSTSSPMRAGRSQDYYQGFWAIIDFQIRACCKIDPSIVIQSQEGRLRFSYDVTISTRC